MDKQKWEKIRVRLTDEKYIFNFYFADDQVIIAQDGENIECIMRKFLDEYRECALKMN